MSYFWMLYFTTGYLWLGYCHASTMRELGILKRSPRYVGFLVMMVLWPVGVMMLPHYIRIVKSEGDEW
ncbi:hypothetical protein [Trabulsiella odontotermitis]|uniref:Uncharacterized protein n=1 Tax=Trabulsiella odontotermitis TaxID=379893 RepID=A0A0L0GX83_9ENTR|nr:hypothetical protein [Trabulsiella odontotermitis]KNC93805.1 hypothetical protein GM31_18000 [Trabulsiella odontotermitis]